MASSKPMKQLKSQHLGFISADAEFADADMVIFGCPWDGTQSYRPGARFGPQAIRQASWGLETFSPDRNRDLAEIKYCDIGDLEWVLGNPQRAMNEIQEETRLLLKQGKIPVALGGEHSVTLPIVRELVEFYPNLRVIQFDAHADLRDEYLGERLSHASVMRRLLDFLPSDYLFQFGIRSGTADEWEFMRKRKTVHPGIKLAMQKVVSKIKQYPVYITVDLDVFDPSHMPGTGTPEPGGIHFRDFTDMVSEMAKLNHIVGFDVVELAPLLDPSGISSVLAAKVVRELLLITGKVRTPMIRTARKFKR